MIPAMARARRSNWLLLLGGCAAGVLLLEGAVRALGLLEPRPTGYAPLDTDRRAGRPRNSRGYRDEERTPAKPPGTRRLLSLGDSFAWGASVHFEDAYPQRLERGLRRRRGEAWEVVNLALPGLGTLDHAAQLAQEGIGYEPDAVVLGYVLNDAEDRATAEAREHAWIQRVRDRHAPLAFSALARFVALRVSATVENAGRVGRFRALYEDSAPGWRDTREALRAMGRLCRERGVPLLVAIFPMFANPLDGRYPFQQVHAKVAQAAAAAGARVVDLMEVYRGRRWELLVVNGYEDEHPNEIAHRLAADAILRALDDVVSFAFPAAAAGGEAPAAPR